LRAAIFANVAHRPLHAGKDEPADRCLLRAAYGADPLAPRPFAPGSGSAKHASAWQTIALTVS
jgi:hypothetical protein